MANWLLKRVGQAILTLVVVFNLTFVLVRLMPGNPYDMMMARMMEQYPSDPGRAERIVELHMNLNPNAPMHVQYLEYMSSVLTGDLGYSLSENEPVNAVLAEAVPWTLFYISTALVITFTFSLCFGAIMAYYEGTRFDTGMTIFAVFEGSTPYYVVALLLVFVFGYQLGWFPTGARYPGGAEIGLNAEFVLGAFHHAALPIISLIVLGAAASLDMRGNSISVLGSDYIRVAQLRGLPPMRIALRYIMRNALLPLWTGILLIIGFSIGGSIVLEEIFNYRGMGFYMYRGVSDRDYALMTGGFMVIAMTVVIAMFIADITYSKIDPRARAEGKNIEVYGSSTGVPLRTQIKRWFNRKLGRSSSPAHSQMRTDGSTPGGEFLTGEEADVDVTRGEVLYRKFDRSIYAPARIVLTDWRGALGISIIVFFVLFGTIGADFVHSPTASFDDWVSPLEGGWDHPLGTDNTGNDVLAQLVYGTKPVLIMITAGALATVSVGVTVGTVAGFRGGMADRVLMTLCDMILAIPGLPLVIVLAAILEPRSPAVVGLVLAVPAWGGLGRAIRSEVLKVRSYEYVEASRAMGVGTGAIILKDILPNILPYVLINLANNARQIIFSSVALYYLGFLPVSTQNWGVMLDSAEGSGALLRLSTVHYILAPMAAIILLSMGLILLAQALDQISNPRIRARHAKSAADDEPV